MTIRNNEASKPSALGNAPPSGAQSLYDASSNSGHRSATDVFDSRHQAGLTATMAEDPLYAAFNNIRPAGAPLFPGARVSSKSDTGGPKQSPNIGETDGGGTAPVVTGQYVRLDDAPQEAEGQSRGPQNIDFEQSRRDLYEQTEELPFAVRGVARFVGNTVLRETQAELEKHRVWRPERAALIPSRHTFDLLEVADEYYVHGHDENGNRRKGGCCGSRNHWSHALKDSEIITTLDWTDDEAPRIASFLYQRSVGHTWSSIANVALLLLSFILLVLVGDGDNPIGLWIVLVSIAAMIGTKEAVNALDRSVVQMIDATFERSGRRKTKEYHPAGVLV